MNTVKINVLLRQKAELSARLNLLPYEEVRRREVQFRDKLFKE